MTLQHTDVRRGIVRAFDAGTYTATVQMDGSLHLNTLTVPVSRDIAAGDLTAGRKVGVAFFDPLNQLDAVVFAVYT